MAKENLLTLKTLTKGIAWELQENDIFRLWDAEKDVDNKENYRHFFDIIRCAFELEEVKTDNEIVLKKLEARGFKLGKISVGEGEKDKLKIAIKKRPISRVTDLTYENIRHISAAKLLEVIDRNFGGGWDSLSQAIKDIIESGFDISTTTLPKDRLHNPGGMYETKLADDFEVLEIEKGTWVEAIFAKAKPIIEKPKADDDEEELGKRGRRRRSDDDDDDDEDVEIEDNYGHEDDEDDALDEEFLEEESYRTTFDADDADLTLDDVEASEDDDY